MWNQGDNRRYVSDEGEEPLLRYVEAINNCTRDVGLPLETQVEEIQRSLQFVL